MVTKEELWKKAELRFKEWVNEHSYPYLYIDQNLNTFSTLFKNLTKRPDFLVVISNIGIIAVDIKFRELSSYQDFILDEEKEISKANSFERIFRIPIWYCFSLKESGFTTFYWISLSEIQEKMPIKISSMTNERFRAISIKNCKTLGWKDNISKLFEI